MMDSVCADFSLSFISNRFDVSFIIKKALLD